VSRAHDPLVVSNFRRRKELPLPNFYFAIKAITILLVLDTLALGQNSPMTSPATLPADRGSSSQSAPVALTPEGSLDAIKMTSDGKDGILNSLGACKARAYACSIIAPALYAQAEAQPWGSGNILEMVPEQLYGPKSTDPLGCLTDYRFGPPQVICNQGTTPRIWGSIDRFVGASPIFDQNVTTVGNGPSPSTPRGLSIFTHVFSGGRDSYIDEVNQTNLNTRMTSNTLGMAYDWQSSLNTFSPADTIPILSRAYAVGASAGQNEGVNYHLHGGETSNVWQGTLISEPVCQVTCTISVKQSNGWGGSIGAGLYLIDVQDGYNSGHSTRHEPTGLITGSGTNWTSLNPSQPTTSITTTKSNIDNCTPGKNCNINTFPQFDVPVRVANIAGLTATGKPITCLFSNIDIKSQCAHAERIDGDTVYLDRVDAPFPAGSTLSQGGVAGMGFGYDLDTKTAANLNGMVLQSDQGPPNGPIRQVFPVIGNTSDSSLKVYYWDDWSTVVPNAISDDSTGAYHLWPMALVLDAYNHSTGALDGSSILTTPTVGAFVVGHTLELPHYYEFRLEGLNVIMTWLQPHANTTNQPMSLSVGGNFRANDAILRLQNENDLTLYKGLPRSLASSTPGRGVLGAPEGIEISGSFANALYAPFPVRGSEYGNLIGTIVQGCGKAANCASWNQPIQLFTVQNKNPYSGSLAEDVWEYNPTTFTHQWTSGAKGWQGNSPSTVMTLGPKGLSLSNLPHSTWPICPNGIDGALTTDGCGERGTEIENVQVSTGTSELKAHSCSPVVAKAMPGLKSSSGIHFTASSDVSEILGWGQNGGLKIVTWPSLDAVNYRVCNQTDDALKPGGVVVWNVDAR